MVRIFSIILLSLACVFVCVGQEAEPPAVIWNAGSLTFIKPTSGTQDCITASTCLTRITVLYNSVTGTVSGHQPCPGYTGPSNTEWAYGDISQWQTLTYQKLFDLNACSPPTMVDRPMVLHLISDNIYLQVKFNYWISADPGFSYTRTTGPAAATASISGRVLQPGGRGVKGAAVTLTDSNNVVRTAFANARGLYTFTNIPNLATYTIAVSTRRWVYAPQSISVTGDMSNRDLVCQPH